MLEDCFKYYKGCQTCQKFGNIQTAPASALHSIIKPWPFRGWGIDIIGQIFPTSSKGHKFILAATDYFSKWVEAISLKRVTSKELIGFVNEHIVHRFGIPQTITTDQGTVFMSREFQNYAKSIGIKLLNSSPYYAQANGQAESSNKTLIKLIKRKIDEKPRNWHTVLSEALWAYRLSYHGSIKLSPFQLVYGHEAVLPVEININSARIIQQDNLLADEYHQAMLDNLDDLAELRLIALDRLKRNKERVARTYNKRVVAKSFSQADLVWKMVLPVGSKDSRFGKWSPTWEGPYKINRPIDGNSYILETLDGFVLPKAINERYLKEYHPSVWIGA